MGDTLVVGALCVFDLSSLGALLSFFLFVSERLGSLINLWNSATSPFYLSEKLEFTLVFSVITIFILGTESYKYKDKSTMKREIMK